MSRPIVTGVVFLLSFHSEYVHQISGLGLLQHDDLRINTTSQRYSYLTSFVCEGNFRSRFYHCPPPGGFATVDATENLLNLLCWLPVTTSCGQQKGSQLLCCPSHSVHISDRVLYVKNTSYSSSHSFFSRVRYPLFFQKCSIFRIFHLFRLRLRHLIPSYLASLCCNTAE